MWLLRVSLVWKRAARPVRSPGRGASILGQELAEEDGAQNAGRHALPVFGLDALRFAPGARAYAGVPAPRFGSCGCPSFLCCVGAADVGVLDSNRRAPQSSAIFCSTKRV